MRFAAANARCPGGGAKSPPCNHFAASQWYHAAERFGSNPMSGRTLDLQQTFPARPLRPDERELVAEWLAAAGNDSSAYVSDRRTDEPAIYRRIAISADGDGAFTHLIHAPFHSNVWMVLHVRHKPEIHHFESLQDALNFVRPVFGQPVLGQPAARPADGSGEQDRDHHIGAGRAAERRRLDGPQFDSDPFR
ncbi:MAG TPA: hypothetical protein VFE41_07105 [Acetobacteraceae bacterium]|nr:hypothetical protein [Acetobacteraceae bacterium]